MATLQRNESSSDDIENTGAGRPKGLPKTGGRKPGTPNRATAEIRQLLQGLFENHLKTFDDDIKAMEPKDRARLMLDIAKFVLPTLKSVDHTTNGESVNRELTIYLTEQ